MTNHDDEYVDDLVWVSLDIQDKRVRDFRWREEDHNYLGVDGHPFNEMSQRGDIRKVSSG